MKTENKWLTAWLILMIIILFVYTCNGCSSRLNEPRKCNIWENKVR